MIADGVRDVSRALTFQKMKGRNGFAGEGHLRRADVPEPEKYAELNVLGQWLGVDDVIGLF